MFTRSALPPGSTRSLLQTYRYARDPYGFLADMLARHGDPFTVHVVNGKLVVTGDPVSVQRIYAADPDTYHPFGADAVRPLLGDASIMLMAGEQHRRERKLLMPAFHGERMRADAETIRAAAHAGAAAWPKARTFVFQDSAQWISLEVIVRPVFGVVDPGRIEVVRAAILELVDAVVPSVLFLPFLQRELLGFGPWARLQRARRRIGTLIAEDLAARRGRPEAAGDDILSSMLAARHDDGAA